MHITIISMADENQDDNAVRSQIEASLQDYYAVHRDEVRRSLEISTGYYEKLATFDAGSIAILVTVGLAILNKSDLNRLSHGLLIVIVCFWVSLLTAICHNYLLLWSAKLDAAYSKDEFVKHIVKTMLRHPWPIDGLASQMLKPIEEASLVDPLNNQKKTTAWKRRCEAIAIGVGIVATASFVFGYSLVVVGAFKIWL